MGRKDGQGSLGLWDAGPSRRSAIAIPSSARPSPASLPAKPGGGACASSGDLGSQDHPRGDWPAVQSNGGIPVMTLEASRTARPLRLPTQQREAVLDAASESRLRARAGQPRERPIVANRPPCLKGSAMSPGTRSARGLSRARGLSPRLPSELSTQPCSHRHRRRAGIGRWAGDPRSSAAGPTVGIPRGLRLNRQRDKLAGPRVEPIKRATSGNREAQAAHSGGRRRPCGERTRKGEKSTRPTTNGAFPTRSGGRASRAKHQPGSGPAPPEGPVDECSSRVYP